MTVLVDEFNKSVTLPEEIGGLPLNFQYLKCKDLKDAQIFGKIVPMVKEYQTRFYEVNSLYKPYSKTIDWQKFNE